jgi:hypothetical protein
MSSPLWNRKRLIAFALESVCGTAETLDAGDAVIVGYDVKIAPDFAPEERQAPGRPGRISSIPGPRSGKVTFKTDLYGSGNSGAPVPALMDLLLPACSCVKTVNTFARSLLAPEAAGAATKTATIGVYVSGKLKMIRGAMGTVKFTFPAGKRAVAEWSFSGLWVAPTDVAMLSATFPTYAPLRAGSGSLTLTYGSDAWTPRANELSIDLGNVLHLMPTLNDTTGYALCSVPNYATGGSLDPLSTLVADHDIFGHILAAHEMSLAYVLGSVAGNRITFSAPALQFTNAQEAEREGTEVDSATFQLNTVSAAGGDELSILFS